MLYAFFGNFSKYWCGNDSSVISFFLQRFMNYYNTGILRFICWEKPCKWSHIFFTRISYRNRISIGSNCFFINVFFCSPCFSRHRKVWRVDIIRRSFDNYIFHHFFYLLNRLRRGNLWVYNFFTKGLFYSIFLSQLFDKSWLYHLTIIGYSIIQH